MAGGLDLRLATHLVAVAEMMMTSSALEEITAYLTQECALLTDLDGAAVLLGRTAEELRHVAVSRDELAGAAEVQRRTGRGPTVALLGGSTETEHDLTAVAGRWPEWSGALAGQGVRRVGVLPLRLVDEAVGGLEVYATDSGPLDPRALQVASVFAGLAVVVAHHDAELRSSSTRQAELTRALESRVAVEQAKGYLRATAQLAPEDAFDRLRRFARRTRRRLDEVSRDLVAGSLTTAEVLATGAGEVPGQPRR